MQRCGGITGLALVLGLGLAGGQGAAFAADDSASTSRSAGQSASETPAAEAARARQAFSDKNPFAQPSSLAFHAPDFDKIDNDDFMPAIEAGMAQQSAAVDKIANNDAAPTFDNTIVALEKSDPLLSRVMPVFNALTGANTNKTLQHVEQVEAPRLAAHSDAIYLDDALFQRVAALHDKADQLDLDPESARLLHEYYDKFVHAGAKLSDADKTKLRDINKRLSSLSTAFTQKLLAANSDHAPIFVNKSALAGMSDDAIAGAAAAGADRHLDDQFVLSLQNTTQQPPLAQLDDRDTRETLYSASWNRAEHGGSDDTRDTIETIAKLRAEKASLLGYDNYAAYTLYDQMAKTPAKAEGFMQRLVGPAKASAKAEAADLQKLIDQSGKSFQLRPWDWNYYAEKLRKQRFDLDESEIKPYFELNNVLENGVFYAAHELYGLRFKERHDLPVYAPSVRVFTVYDADGSKLGLFYADYYKRDNKNGGAWMSNLVGQSKLLGTQPVIYNVANIDKPPKGKPTLLSYDDVVTLFHEFGHALNGFFADTEYPMLSGTATPRDFVEFPSQINEHWAIYPKVFDHYAKNYKTGKPMPEALKKKLLASVHFNQGYDMSELISAALLDMAWHTIPADAPKKQADAFQREALQKAGMYMPNLVPPRYRSSYFQHIWGNGYAAGYYAYLWTQMLADDGFTWFTENGGLTRENGDRFRRMILSIGNTRDLQKAYDAWRGRAPQIGPMLKNRGLAGHGSDDEPSDDAQASNDAS
ncbi:M3 family metallopeptidase [Salinisphaera sp. Q1T1-3]|uniref:M3 family metallopeptidase n=1 Tax=Salinisphaera sp. Q1T1-3 TaxID=2321229 RepID=UPI000E71D681|nr:M3 family metallopeptidase [Salinisphaera sp. Q1T1-3]RJS93614.1 M3 family peptidase [Salinisphaera sp. Q1T1-3]